jgi:hypothetical protein
VKKISSVNIKKHYKNFLRKYQNVTRAYEKVDPVLTTRLQLLIKVKQSEIAKKIRTEKVYWFEKIKIFFWINL